MFENKLSSVYEIRQIYIEIHIMRSPAAILDFGSHLEYMNECLI